MIRNAPDAEGAAVVIPGFGVMTEAMLRRAARRPPHRVVVARRDGRTCATCGGALGDTEAAWLRPTYFVQQTIFGPDDCKRIAPHHGGCIEPWRARITFHADVGLCAGCGRQLYRVRDGRRRRFEACSDRCRQLAAIAARKAARQPARGHRCAVCGSPFTARWDAVSCSPACRQKAYRRRRDVA